MAQLEFKNGLLYTSVELTFENKSITVNDVIIDTGASNTIILTDFIREINVEFSDDDVLVKSSGYGGVMCSAIRKTINKVTLDDISLEDFKIDFGVIDPYERVNGLIGLDFLKKAGVVIDLVNLKIYKQIQLN